MTEPFWAELYRHLVRVSPESPHPDEQMAFILASVNWSTPGVSLLAHEMVPATPADFLYQSTGGLEPRPEFVAGTIKRCLKEGWNLIEVHSHPFDSSSYTTFSSIDWGNDRMKMPAIASIIPEPFLHATMVVGQNALDAHFYDRSEQCIQPISQIMIVGDHIQRRLTTTGRSHKRLEQQEQTDERYQRQEMFFGSATQRALSRATVAIVGLGGLGSHVALQLAHLGVGHFILIDPDYVELTNLNRLIGARTNDVGRYKVDVYSEMIEQISKITRVTPVYTSLIDRSDSEAIDWAKSADVIVGCVDNDGTRRILNQIAVRYLIPLVDGGTGIHLADVNHPLAVGGQVQRVVPGSGCLECRGYINPQRAHFDLASRDFQETARLHGYGTDETAPSVIYLNGTIASQQVEEVVHLLSGTQLTPQPRPQIIVYDALKRKMTPVYSSGDPACPTCGVEGSTGIGDFDPIVFEEILQAESDVEQILASEPILPSTLPAEEVLALAHETEETPVEAASDERDAFGQSDSSLPAMEAFALYEMDTPVQPVYTDADAEAAPDVTPVAVATDADTTDAPVSDTLASAQANDETALHVTPVAVAMDAEAHDALLSDTLASAQAHDALLNDTLASAQAHDETALDLAPVAVAMDAEAHDAPISDTLASAQANDETALDVTSVGSETDADTTDALLSDTLASAQANDETALDVTPVAVAMDADTTDALDELALMETEAFIGVSEESTPGSIEDEEISPDTSVPAGSVELTELEYITDEELSPKQGNEAFAAQTAVDASSDPLFEAQGEDSVDTSFADDEQSAVEEETASVPVRSGHMIPRRQKPVQRHRWPPFPFKFFGKKTPKTEMTQVRAHRTRKQSSPKDRNHA